MNVNVQMEQDVAWLSVEGGLMGVVSGVFVGVAIVVVKKGLCHKRLLSKRLLLKRLLLLSQKVKAGGGQGGSVAGRWYFNLVVQQIGSVCQQFLISTFCLGKNFEINEVTAAVTSKQLNHNAWNWHKTFNILKDKPLTMTQKDCLSWVCATFTDGAAPKTDPWRSDRF